MQPPVHIRTMINDQEVLGNGNNGTLRQHSLLLKGSEDAMLNSKNGFIAGQSPFLQNNTGLVNMA